MTRLLIIAADPLIRSALAATVERSDELQTLGQASPDDEPTELIGVYRPDAVIFDAGWEPSADLGQVPADWPLPVILLIPEKSELASDLLTAGFGALLPRDVGSDRLDAAVQAALNDLTVIDPIFLEQMAPAADGRSAQKSLVEVEPLTPREFDVLEHLADGLTNREIAAQLEISHHTVKFHLTSLMDKLDVHSRTEAVTTASRLGILEI